MNLEEEIIKSVELLKKGKMLLYPTDTIWGIGCDATNSKAIQRIYKLKGRNENKGMIVLLDSPDKLKDYIKNVPPIAYDLIENSKSPLTIVYSGAKNLSKNIIAQDGSIAIRVVKGEYCAEVISRFGKPIVSTSANFSYQPAALSFDQIDNGIIDGVDHVVSVFRDRVGHVKPSTIIKFEEDGTFLIIRD
ncbi:MAG: threonylcarbamoyl-AMP synthase [Bacteroidetes bacterium]|nr:threonylcarbamoyl-AMP synthase [Bacteroidota bacterium]MBL6943636.1 threonylcarbamoyl-AMP synthase [Bacteroidales bacterium]